MAVVGGLVLAGVFVAAPQIGNLRSPHAGDDPSTYAQQRTQPLGQPPEVRRGLGTFAFLGTQPKSERPVAYDPCRVIEYAVNNQFAPAGGDALIERAVRQVERATGLVFERVADTDEHPTFRSGVFSVEEGPVIIDWTSSLAVPELLGFTAGVGGSISAQGPTSRERYYLTGAIALDTYQLEKLLPKPRGKDQVQAVIMHELGHLVGLAHVKDRRELMHKNSWGQYSFGPGDREGLAALGSGSCLST